MTTPPERKRLGDCIVGDVVRFPDGNVARLAWPGREPQKKASKKGEIAGWFLEFLEASDFGESKWGDPRWFDAAADVELLDSPNTRAKAQARGDEGGDEDPLLKQTESRRKSRANPNQEKLI